MWILAYQSAKVYTCGTKDIKNKYSYIFLYKSPIMSPSLSQRSSFEQTRSTAHIDFINSNPMVFEKEIWKQLLNVFYVKVEGVQGEE